MFVPLLKIFLFNPALEILYFPFWWYTQGLKKRFIFFLQKVKENWQNLALKILIAHLFKPMYGDWSREGRIISFFMRLVHLNWRFFRLSLMVLFHFIILILWLLLPVLAFYQIICFLFDCPYFFLPRF